MNAAQCRMARAALQLGVRELAAKAKVSPATIVRFEASGELRERTVDAIQRALEAAGVIFVDGNGEGSGIQIRKFRHGDIVRLKQAGSIAGIKIKKGQTGIVTVVKVDVDGKGPKYRVTVQFDDVSVPVAPEDIELLPRPARER
jgi:transcriptional regulator with XRE-family HTH domain